MTSPSAQFSLTLRVEFDRRPGMLGEVATAIGDAGGSIGDIETVELGDIKAIREITVDTVDADDIVRTVKLLAPSFGGINLEDISSPRCFEIESRLVEELDIPVFHDDQHGTAIVVLAALLNACRLTDRNIEGVKVAMIGAGAAGVAVAKILMNEGVTQVVACDRQGSIHSAREDYLDSSMNPPKVWLAE